MSRIDKASSYLEISHPPTRINKHADITFCHQLVVASNVASAYSALPAKGYVVGDVNDRNILVNEVKIGVVSIFPPPLLTDSGPVTPGPGPSRPPPADPAATRGTASLPSTMVLAAGFTVRDPLPTGRVRRPIGPTPP
jgi:hypothetical protein